MTISEIFDDDCEMIAYNYAYTIHNEGKTVTARKMRQFLRFEVKSERAIRIKGALRCDDRKLNYSQINLITTRTIDILETINFIKEHEKDTQIRGRMTKSAMDSFCEKNNWDLHTLSIAMEIMYGAKDEDNSKAPMGKLIAFLR